MVAAQSTGPSEDRGLADEIWEEVLNTVNAALRDAERIKDSLTGIDFERIKSAFNCQAPGAETLSAEQIVIEHAFEQAKSVMTCGAPDDLGEFEDVVPRTVISDTSRIPSDDEMDRERTERQLCIEALFHPGSSFGVTFHRDSGIVYEVEDPGLAKQMGVKVEMRIDTIDDEPYSWALYQEKESGSESYVVKFTSEAPSAAATSIDLVGSQEPAQSLAPIDLLDTSLRPVPETSSEAPLIEVAEAPQAPAPVADLLDLSIEPSEHEHVGQLKKAPIPDLLDLSDALRNPVADISKPECDEPLPVVGGLPEVHHTGLLDIDDLAKKGAFPTHPMPSSSVNRISDLLDLSESQQTVAVM